MQKYQMQDPRTVDRVGYSLDPMEQSQGIPEDPLARLDELIERREKVGRTQAYQRPVHDIDLFSSNNSSQMGGLARVLSNMSAGSGTYKGVTPDNKGFNEVIKDFDASNQRDFQNRMNMQKMGDDTLLENIKLSSFAEEERKKQEFGNRKVDPTTRQLMIKAYGDLGISDVGFPDEMTYREMFEDPTRKSVYESITKKQQYMNPYQMGMLEINRQKNQNDAFVEQQKVGIQKDSQEAREALARESLAIKKKYLDRRDKGKIVSGVNVKQGPLENKQKEELRKAEETTANALATLSKMEEMVKKYGTSEQSNQGIDATMQGLSASAILQQKELENLGVLNAGDLPILEQLIPRLGGAQGALQVNKRALAKIIEAQRMLKMKLENKRKGIQGTLGQSTSKFPMTLRKNGVPIQIEDENDLKEATAQGWK